ncbi:MAG: 2'-5' RNA ligase family protein [bacterium]|nr:2'-5' RNA ligase family protein [bacterium]
MLPDLSQIARTIVWHAKDNEHKDSVGIFAVLPREIARQFPEEGRQDEDSSPAHTTVLYVGEVLPALERKLLKVVQEVCEATKPFLVKLKKPRKFVNAKGQIILHSPVKSNRLVRFHENLRSALLNAGIQVDNKFPEFKPHVTIAYCSNRKELNLYKEVQPVGEWVVDSIWLWSTRQPHLILLGR